MQLRALVASKPPTCAEQRPTQPQPKAPSNEFSTMLHLSVTRYLMSTRAETSLFRSDALIDPETNKQMERQRCYVSPYSRAFIGDITIKTRLPKLELETKESRLSRHRQDIELVNKNVLDVDTNAAAINKFAKKYRKHQKQLSLEAAGKKENLSPSGWRLKSLSRDKSSDSFGLKLGASCWSYHHRLAKHSAKHPEHRDNFIKFLNPEQEKPPNEEHSSAHLDGAGSAPLDNKKNGILTRHLMNTSTFSSVETTQKHKSEATKPTSRHKGTQSQYLESLKTLMTRKGLKELPKKKQGISFAVALASCKTNETPALSRNDDAALTRTALLYATSGASKTHQTDTHLLKVTHKAGRNGALGTLKTVLSNKNLHSARGITANSSFRTLASVKSMKELTFTGLVDENRLKSRPL